MVLVVSIGILAAVVVPQFGGVTDDARAAATSGAVSGVRASISGYRTRAILTEQAPFPTLAQLNEQGLVVQDEFPVNPFNNLRNVQSVSSGQAAARAVVNPTAAGWKLTALLSWQSGQIRLPFKTPPSLPQSAQRELTSVPAVDGWKKDCKTQEHKDIGAHSSVG